MYPSIGLEGLGLGLGCKFYSIIWIDISIRKIDLYCFHSNEPQLSHDEKQGCGFVANNGCSDWLELLFD
jgi:hypothetical protein